MKLPQHPIENPELLSKVPAIYELRKKGWKIHVSHQRFYDNIPIPLSRTQARFLDKVNNPIGRISATGGLTTIEMFDGQKSYSGMSICTMSDNFCYKKGVKIAIYKALNGEIAFKENNIV